MRTWLLRSRQVLAYVTEQTLQMTAADLVALALPDAARRQLLISHAAGEGAQRALGLVLPAEASLSWEVLATGQAARVEDFRHDERVARAFRLWLLALGRVRDDQLAAAGGTAHHRPRLATGNPH